MSHSRSLDRISHRISKKMEWAAMVASLLVCACSSDSVSVSSEQCGNGMLDDGEICDGQKFSPNASCLEGSHLPEGASLSCNEDCSLNTDACVPASPDKPCGNGILDDGEICDGENFSPNASCLEGSHLPEGARLSCNEDCSLNTDACVPASTDKPCGNGILDDGEICDGEKFSKDAQCQKGSHLPEGAHLGCNEDCTLNTDACVPDDDLPIEPQEKCGNGNLDEGEECDDTLIPESASCPENMHLPDGKALACLADCTLDTSACEITISTTIPQGRVVPDEKYAAGLTEIPLHRTPQHAFPNKDLYADREDEPSQIVIHVPKDTVLDIIGSVGSKWLVKYNGEEGYIHSMHVQRVNDLEIPKLNYSSPSTSNYYQKDEKWKDVQVGTVGKIETHGGVPVAVADAVTSLKGSSITPDVIANKVGTYLGKSTDYICQLVKKEYQLKCEYLDNNKGMNGGGNTTNDAATRSKTKAKMQEAFKKGWYVVAEEGCGESSYWGNKRTILVYGYDEKNDRIYVDDPQNRHYMQEKGMESFLDCNHTMSIITNTCVPKTCESSACGNNIDDGCGGKLNCPCTATGTIVHSNAVMCRRAPQNRGFENYGVEDILNNTHQNGLSESEPPLKVKDVLPGETFELLTKIDNSKNKSKDNQIWYQVKINNEYCFLPASFLDVKTNGVNIPNYNWSSGSTINYKQQDPRWRDHTFSNGTKTIAIGGDGCGMTSLANAISALTGNPDYRPDNISDEYTKAVKTHDDYESFCTVARSYGLNCSGMNTNCGRGFCSGAETQNGVRQAEKDLLKTTFEKGGYVLALQFTGYWTTKSHWITVYSYDKERNIIFADDPMNRKYMQNIEGLLNTNMYMIAITPK